MRKKLEGEAKEEVDCYQDLVEEYNAAIQETNEDHLGVARLPTRKNILSRRIQYTKHVGCRREKERAMQAPTNGAAPGAVYVQTNRTPNEVVAFRRAGNGSLEPIGSVATGGDGDGSPHLQSQGSVVLTGDGQHLLVTNAASDDLSVFSVDTNASIELRERVHTGDIPRSVDEHDGLVVVLNTGEPSLASFRLDSAGITPVEGGRQALEADADPAQVAFGPDGSMVAITERGTDSIVTYEIASDGTFGASRAVASEGPTPYGFAFTSGGTLVVTEAFRAEKGAAAASSYAVVDGSLEVRTSSVGNGRSEICWAVITPDDRFAFTTNYADGAVSRFGISADGSLLLEDATAGLSVDGVPGLRDEDLSDDGQFLYAIDADGGRIYGWSVGAGGALEPVGSWEGMPETVAGLAAS
jgi:6-phosphogluconolactonase